MKSFWKKIMITLELKSRRRGGSMRRKADINFQIEPTHKYTGIVWHHSKTPDGTVHDWESLSEYHTSHRVNHKRVDAFQYRKAFIQQRGAHFGEPMERIGYHLGVEFAENKEGAFVPTLRIGRPFLCLGEHLPEIAANREYVGLVAIGDFDTKAMRPEMYDMCLRITRKIAEHFEFEPENIMSHWEWAQRHKRTDLTSCPGSLWDFEKFRQDL